MNEFLSRQQAVLVAIGLLVLYVVMATVTPPEHLKRFMDAGRFGFALTVALVCARPAFEVFRQGARDRGDQVTVAVFLVWAVTTFAGAWIPANRELPWPEWFPNDQITAIIPYLYMISAAFFLIPIGNGSRDLPTGNWPVIAAAAAVGGTAVGFMLGMGVSL